MPEEDKKEVKAGLEEPKEEKKKGPLGKLKDNILPDQEEQADKDNMGF